MSSRSLRSVKALVAVAFMGGAALMAASACHRGAVDEPPFPEAALLRAGRTEVPMDLATGRPVVEVKVNGEGPYLFILDTGAGTTVIDEELARELELPVTGQTALGDPTDPEAIPAAIVKAASLEMGGMELRGVSAATMALRRMMGSRYGGILGFPHLEEFLVTLDYPQGRVVLSRGELDAGGPGVVDYDSEDCLISLPMMVAGEEVTAHLDSGNPGSFMLPLALRDRWKLEGEPVEVGMAGTVNNMTTIYQARIDGEIEFAGLAWSDPEVHLSDLLDDWANVGFDALRDVELTVDQKNRRLRMARVEGAAAPPPARRRVGVAFAGMTSLAEGLPIRDGALEIGMVAPGSPAEGAGLEVGDRILEVNSRPVVEYDPHTLFQAFGRQGRIDLKLDRAGEILTVIVE